MSGSRAQKSSRKIAMVGMLDLPEPDSPLDAEFSRSRLLMEDIYAGNQNGTVSLKRRLQGYEFSQRLKYFFQLGMWLYELHEGEISRVGAEYAHGNVTLENARINESLGSLSFSGLDMAGYSPLACVVPSGARVRDSHYWPGRAVGLLHSQLDIIALERIAYFDASFSSKMIDSQVEKPVSLFQDLANALPKLASVLNTKEPTKDNTKNSVLDILASVALVHYKQKEAVSAAWPTEKKRALVIFALQSLSWHRFSTLKKQEHFPQVMALARFDAQLITKENIKRIVAGEKAREIISSAITDSQGRYKNILDNNCGKPYQLAILVAREAKLTEENIWAKLFLGDKNMIAAILALHDADRYNPGHESFITSSNIALFAGDEVSQLSPYRRAGFLQREVAKLYVALGIKEPLAALSLQEKTCQALLVLHQFDSACLTRDNIAIFSVGSSALREFANIVTERVKGLKAKERGLFKTEKKTTLQRAVFTLARAEGQVSDQHWEALLEGIPKNLRTLACLRGQQADFINHHFTRASALSDKQKSIVPLCLQCGLALTDVEKISDKLCEKVYQFGSEYPQVLTQENLSQILEQEGEEEQESTLALLKKEVVATETAVDSFQITSSSHALDTAVKAAMKSQHSTRTIDSTRLFGRWSDEKKKAYVILSRCGLKPDRDIPRWYQRVTYYPKIIALYALDPLLVTQENIDVITGKKKKATIASMIVTLTSDLQKYQSAVRMLRSITDKTRCVTIENILACADMSDAQKKVAAIYAARGLAEIWLARNLSDKECDRITDIKANRPNFLNQAMHVKLYKPSQYEVTEVIQDLQKLTA